LRNPPYVTSSILLLFPLSYVQVFYPVLRSQNILYISALERHPKMAAKAETRKRTKIIFLRYANMHIVVCIVVIAIGVLGTNAFTKLSPIFVLCLQCKDKLYFLVIKQTQ
jgi:hypothetical protein